MHPRDRMGAAVVSTFGHTPTVKELLTLEEEGPLSLMDLEEKRWYQLTPLKSGDSFLNQARPSFPNLTL